MPYVIRTYYHDDKNALRLDTRLRHVAYLQANLARIIAAGPLANEDGSAAGGLTIVDTDSRAEAEAFRANDPYSKAGIVRDFTIHKWRKSVFDFAKIGD